MSGKFADYYALLRVAKGAGDLEIEAAFIRCIAILKEANMSPEDREKARQLYDHALFILGDPERRRAYDADCEVDIAKCRYLAILARAGVPLDELKAAVEDEALEKTALTDERIGRTADSLTLAEYGKVCEEPRAFFFERETFVVGTVFALLLATVWMLEIAIEAGRPSPDMAPLLERFIAAASPSK